MIFLIKNKEFEKNHDKIRKKGWCNKWWEVVLPCTTSHRSASNFLKINKVLYLQLTVIKIVNFNGFCCLFFLSIYDFCIDLSGFNISMSQHFADSEYVSTICQL